MFLLNIKNNKKLLMVNKNEYRKMPEFGPKPNSDRKQIRTYNCNSLIFQFFQIISIIKYIKS